MCVGGGDISEGKKFLKQQPPNLIKKKKGSRQQMMPNTHTQNTSYIQTSHHSLSTCDKVRFCAVTPKTPSALSCIGRKVVLRSRVQVVVIALAVGALHEEFS